MLSAERERAYLEILERGILNVRALLARGDTEQALVEVNHVHNLAALVRGELGQSESAYWDVARADYLRSSKPGWPSVFSPMWEVVGPRNAEAPLGARAS